MSMGGYMLLVAPPLQPTKPRTPKPAKTESEKPKRAPFWSRKHRHSLSFDSLNAPVTRPGTALPTNKTTESIPTRPIQVQDIKNQVIEHVLEVPVDIKSISTVSLQDSLSLTLHDLTIRNSRLLEADDFTTSFAPSDDDTTPKKILQAPPIPLEPPPKIPQRLRPFPLRTKSTYSHDGSLQPPKSPLKRRETFGLVAPRKSKKNIPRKSSIEIPPVPPVEEFGIFNDVNYDDVMLVIDTARARRGSKATTHRRTKSRSSLFNNPDTPPLPNENTSDLKSYLTNEDLYSDCWKTCEPPSELYFIADPENTPQEILQLLNDDRLEEDVEAVRNPPLNLTKRSTDDSLTVSENEDFPLPSPSSSGSVMLSRNSVAMSFTTAASSAPDFASPIALQSMSRWSISSNEGDSALNLDKKRSTKRTYATLSKNFGTSRPKSEYKNTLSFKKYNTRRLQVECVTCNNDIRDQKPVSLDCGHKYCHGCLRSHVLNSIKNEGSFPPRCCSDVIPTCTINGVLSLLEQALVRTKAEEYSLVPQDRIYCPSMNCGKFVPLHCIPNTLDLPAQCSACMVRICQRCRGLEHLESVVCPEQNRRPQFRRLSTKRLDIPIPSYRSEASSKYSSGSGQRFSMTVSDVSSNIVDHERDSFLVEKYQYLTTILRQILDTQESLIASRHTRARSSFSPFHHLTGNNAHDNAIDAIKATFDVKVAERSADVIKIMNTEIETLADQHDEEEDDLLITLTKRHRGKTNKDERIELAIRKLKEQQSLEIEDVRTKYTAQLTNIKSAVQAEIDKNIEELSNKQSEEILAEQQQWHDVARREMADEMWFEAIREIRFERLNKRLEDEKVGKSGFVNSAIKGTNQDYRLSRSQYLDIEEDVDVTSVLSAMGVHDTDGFLAGHESGGKSIGSGNRLSVQQKGELMLAKMLEDEDEMDARAELEGKKMKSGGGKKQQQKQEKKFESVRVNLGMIC